MVPEPDLVTVLVVGFALLTVLRRSAAPNRPTVSAGAGALGAKCTMDRLGPAVWCQLQCLVRERLGTVRAHPLQKSRHIFYTFSFPSDLTGLQVDSSKDRVVVDQAPDAISDLLEPDVFSLERIAQEILPGVERNVPHALTLRISK